MMPETHSLRAFEAGAQPQEIRTRTLVAGILAQPALTAKFLNTLSLLEHVGSRKIMASQSRLSRPALDHAVLKHLAEETRHALFFKRAAEKLAQRPLSYDTGDLIAGPAAIMYMARLDAMVGKKESGVPAYLHMSMVIEFRAIWLYRLLQDCLKRAGLTLNLNSVLAEEALHLQEMQASLASLGGDFEKHAALFIAYEAGRFEAWLAQTEAALETAPRAQQAHPH